MVQGLVKVFPHSSSSFPCFPKAERLVCQKTNQLWHHEKKRGNQTACECACACSLLSNGFLEIISPLPHPQCLSVLFTWQPHLRFGSGFRFTNGSHHPDPHLHSLSSFPPPTSNTSYWEQGTITLIASFFVVGSFNETFVCREGAGALAGPRGQVLQELGMHTRACGLGPSYVSPPIPRCQAKHARANISPHWNPFWYSLSFNDRRIPRHGTLGQTANRATGRLGKRHWLTPATSSSHVRLIEISLFPATAGPLSSHRGVTPSPFTPPHPNWLIEIPRVESRIFSLRLHIGLTVPAVQYHQSISRKTVDLLKVSVVTGTVTQDWTFPPVRLLNVSFAQQK